MSYSTATHKDINVSRDLFRYNSGRKETDSFYVRPGSKEATAAYNAPYEPISAQDPKEWGPPNMLIV